MLFRSHPIFVQNRDYMVESLNVYMKHLEQFRDAIRDGESRQLEALILNANRIRAILNGESPRFLKNEETFVTYFTK